MMETGLVFLIFWGVWILIPIVVDGVETISRLLTVFLSRRKKKTEIKVSKDELPYVSVVIPAHNEAMIIDRCLNSLKIQDYPHDRLEVIVVDDGSTDGTQEKVQDHINGNGKNGKNGTSSNGVRINGKFVPVGDFSGVLRLFCRPHGGKAEALNTGITHSHGEIIFNIDSDVVLAPHAIRKMVEAFLNDPILGAATGNIEICPDIIEERDKNGHLILDEVGNPIPKQLRTEERLLAASQFFEYLSAFCLGREAQSATNTLYTLSGAFSAFRRNVLFKSTLYRSNTVSEDTDLTLDLHRQPIRIGYEGDAKAYLEPVIEWDKLYSQRVRWNRGQLEVCGYHRDMCGRPEFGWLGFFGIPKMLTVDHTLAFPRLIWTLILPFFVLFGYSSKVIFSALFLMYVFYTLVEALNTLAAYLISDQDTQKKVKKYLPYVFLLPLYRFVVFHFRMSGYLVVLQEPPSWSIPGPVNGIKNGVKKFKHGLNTGLNAFLANLKLAFLKTGSAVKKQPALISLIKKKGLMWLENWLGNCTSYLFLLLATVVLWWKGELKLPSLPFSLSFFNNRGLKTMDWLEKYTSFLFLPLGMMILWREGELKLPSMPCLFFRTTLRKLKEAVVILMFIGSKY